MPVICSNFLKFKNFLISDFKSHILLYVQFHALLVLFFDYMFVFEPIMIDLASLSLNLFSPAIILTPERLFIALESTEFCSEIQFQSYLSALVSGEEPQDSIPPDDSKPVEDYSNKTSLNSNEI